jgi:NTP pyrophosphatase (non-canonical NTP hydrolase)
MTGTSIIEAIARYRTERNRREGLIPAELTDIEADKLMCTLLSHTLEELVELLMTINRKSWKPIPSIRSDTTQRALALEELADVLLMLDAFRSVAQISYAEIETAVLSKIAKNLVRADHACNANLAEGFTS